MNEIRHLSRDVIHEQQLQYKYAVCSNNGNKNAIIPILVLHFWDNISSQPPIVIV